MVNCNIARALLSAGTQTPTATFTPTNTANYTTVLLTPLINVTQLIFKIT